MSFLRIIIHKPTNTERGGTFTTIYTKQQRSTAPFKAFASHSSALCRKRIIHREITSHFFRTEFHTIFDQEEQLCV